MSVEFEIPSKMELQFAKLRKMIECPICLEYPKSIPIYQCNLGHVHCKHCHPKLKSCPICRSKTIGIRALIAEHLLETLVRNCKHPSCNIKSFDIEEHEKDCEFALVECAQCLKNVIRRELLLHETYLCPFRKILCFGCNNPIIAKDNEDHQKNQCTFRVVKCELPKCNQEVLFKDMEEHKSKCETEGIECSICQRLVQRRFLESHESQCYRCYICQEATLKSEAELHDIQCTKKAFVYLILDEGQNGCFLSNRQKQKFKKSMKRHRKLSEEEWFHGFITREDSENLLQQRGDFLVRYSMRKRGFYFLTVRIASKSNACLHFLISDIKKSEKVQLVRTWGRDETFDSLRHCINTIADSKILGHGIRLINPIPKII